MALEYKGRSTHRDPARVMEMDSIASEDVHTVKSSGVDGKTSHQFLFIN